MSPVQEQKAALRRELRGRLSAIRPGEHAELSKRAGEALMAESIYQTARSILIYMPLQYEVDVRLLIARAEAEGRAVALPRFIPETGKYGAFFIGDKPLAPGRFGTLEPDPGRPAELNRLDLIVVPGLGFDRRGRRLGRGKGFYDRLLSEACGAKCGICFDEQVLAEVPAEPHDADVDYLATPSRWLDCRG